jgi:hypothetical protein
MRRSLRSPQGFTIAEVIVGAVLLAIITAVSYQFYNISKAVWVYIYVQGDLERTAMIGLEQMIHGLDVENVVVSGQGYSTRKGVQEAGNIIQPAMGVSASQIEFEDQDTPGVSRMFFMQGDRLVYMDDLDNNRDIIDSDLQSLTFTRLIDDVVVIDLTLQRVVLDRQLSANVTTTIELRNM